MNQARVLLTLDQVTVQRGGRCLLEQVSTEIHAQRFHWLIGRNGAGKSTLLQVMAGLLAPDQGCRRPVRPDLRLGYVPQQLSIPESLPLRVRDFLALSGRPAAPQLLAQLEIGALLNQPVQRLSGGERQRVLLAQALQDQPQLLLLDEPLQGLDWRSQQALQALVHALPEQGIAVVMVSHDLPRLQAAQDWVICLDRMICCQGYLPDIAQHHAYRYLYRHDYVPLSAHRQAQTHGQLASVPVPAGQQSVINHDG